MSEDKSFEQGVLDDNTEDDEASVGVAKPHMGADGKMHLYSHDADAKRTEVTLKSNIQLLVVLAFLATIFFTSQILKPSTGEAPRKSTDKPLLVDTVTVMPQQTELLFERTGTVKARNRIMITPQVSGRVVDVHKDFRSGSVFPANKTLFRIEQTDFANQVEIARADLRAAKTALDIARAEHEAATDEWYSLHAAEEIPPLVARIPQLKEAKSVFNAAKVRLADAELDVRRSRFSLPFAGYVVESTIEQGQYVQAGQSCGEVYTHDSLEVNVPVEDRLLAWLLPDNESDTSDLRGGTVDILLTHHGKDYTVQGTIKRVGSVLDPVSRFANVIIEPDDSDRGKFLPGAFVDVVLKGRVTDGVYIVPNATLQEGDALWAVSDDNKLRRYEPEVLSIQNEQTFLHFPQQDVGELALVKGLLKVASDGMTVRMVEDSPAAESKEEGSRSGYDTIRVENDTEVSE